MGKKKTFKEELRFAHKLTQRLTDDKIFLFIPNDLTYLCSNECVFVENYTPKATKSRWKELSKIVPKVFYVFPLLNNVRLTKTLSLSL